MAKPKFLSLDGVRTLVQWAKDQLATKVDKVAGKDLSDNNYSDDDVAKLESIENGAQSNIIESISVNNVAQAIDDKNVNIAIPLVDDTLTNSGQSADAKATGDAIAEVNQSLSQTATAIRQEFDDADNQLAQEMTQALEELSGTIPTKTSELTNDSDYTTKGYVDDEIADTVAAIPTKTSQITNDSDFTTKQYVDGELDTLEASIPTKVSQLQNDSSYATTTQLTDGLATKEGTLQYGTATAEDVGKAMMPKTVADGKVTSWEFGEAGKVDDIQVNGTSVLENKVANIPVATSSRYGVVKTNVNNGIGVDSNGLLYIHGSIGSDSKTGTVNKNPITPSTQHYATFYGLAKAAGDTTQSASNNAVGAYTDSAKTAIQSMLGIDSAIAEAISDITSFEFQVVTELPATGTKGIIYLRAHFHEDNDVYDEYIWVTDRYERLGTLDIDLSNYVTFDDYATASKPGVVKVGNQSTRLTSGNGVFITDNGVLALTVANDSNVKAGISSTMSIVPSNQHSATFYGLAKVAGVDMKSSNNAVGTYTSEAKSAIQSMLGVPSEDDVVTDVQVNGTSVVTDGVAEIPLADINTLGVQKVNGSYGIASSVNGTTLSINRATSANIKKGTEPYKPIVPANQNESTFYGLARAAGDTTQSSSSNAVGTYTDSAKTAIQSMLGVPSEDEVVTDVQVNGTSIVTDGVAEIPIADSNTMGVVKVSNINQTGLQFVNGELQIFPANPSDIKSAWGTYRVLTPPNQHSATFYGLAKAAGDTTQSASANAVGTYTNSAKASIKNMLGFATSSDISDAIDNLVNTRYHVCEPGEYNSTTYIPTLAGELGVIYLVPKPIGDTGIDNDSITGTAQIGTATIATTNNIFYEYIYTGDKFEQIGDTKVDLTGYITDADIATDASVTTMLNQVFS